MSDTGNVPKFEK